MKKKFFSIKWKVVILILLAVILTSAISLIVTLPVVNREISELASNNMEDMVVSNGSTIDEQIDVIGVSTSLNYNSLQEKLGEVQLADTPSSYMYVVSPDGTFLYHPTKDLVGTKDDNAKIAEILENLDNEDYPRHAFFSYRENGKAKYAAYSIGVKKQHVLILSADQSDVLSSVNEITTRCILGAIVAILVCGAFGYINTKFLISPLIGISKDAQRLSDLDFTESGNSIRKNNDEIGIMVDALTTLRVQLRDTINRINHETNQLNLASNELNTAAEETASNVAQVDNAIRAIATGSASQAQQTQDATNNVMEMGRVIEETSEDAKMLLSNATDMLNAGEHALEILDNLEAINQRTKDAVNIIDEQTLKTNQSVKQIMQATDLITAIADETNLLSLNASIEAARAGEAGRGFAVVASEIQKLAEQSNASANEINEIIQELITESDHSVEVMSEMKGIIETQDAHVGDTKHAFHEVKYGIDRSIEGVERISQQTQRLGSVRGRVVDVVNGLTEIAQQNAAAAQETSSATAEVSNIMMNITSESDNVHNIAASIQEDMDKMKAE